MTSRLLLAPSVSCSSRSARRAPTVSCSRTRRRSWRTRLLIVLSRFGEGAPLFKRSDGLAPKTLGPGLAEAFGVCFDDANGVRLAQETAGAGSARGPRPSGERIGPAQDHHCPRSPAALLTGFGGSGGGAGGGGVHLEEHGTTGFHNPC